MKNMDELKQLKDTVIDQNIKVHAQEAAVYEKIHPQLFNWYHSRKSWRDMTYIFNLLNSEKDINVLDLGCGTGFLTMKALKWEKAVVTAVDLSKEMLSVLEGKITPDQRGRISLVNQEALLFLKSNTVKYDLIMTSALLHHLVDVRELLELAVKNLKYREILYVAYEPLKQPINNKLRFMLHRIIRKLDIFIFGIHMKILGIVIEKEHEKSLADYQTTMGGVDPVEIISYLENNGTIVKFDRFATRANGLLAFIADRIIRSQNTFSVIFKKT